MAPVPATPSSTWTVIHTLQAVLGGAAVTAEALSKAMTGTVSTDAGIAAIILTAVLAGLSFFTNAAFGPAAAEVKALRAMVKR